MTTLFYLASAIAVFATARVITHKDPMHALLYFVVSLVSLAVVLFTLGAQVIAPLMVMIYAGAIIVLFVFVIMILNLGPKASEQESRFLSPGIWVGPSILCGILLVQLIVVLVRGDGHVTGGAEISKEQVSVSLFNVYFLGVELASMLLLAALVGAYHLGKRELPGESEGGEL
jgi:NADH-quinone oxidoreductase subunit J